MATATKLTKGTRYDVDTLELAGWVGDSTGLSCWDYFGRDGEYLGADQDGVEPLFSVAAPDGEYGDLMDYHTADCIRPATKAERDASRTAGPEGVILVDADGRILEAGDSGADDARRCYVQE